MGKANGRARGAGDKRGLGVAAIGVLVLTASCSVNVTTDNSPARHPAPPPPQHAAAPPPPAAAPTPPPAHPAAAPAAPAARAAVAPVQQHQAVAPAIGNTAINLRAVQSFRAKSPKACGYMEVSPSNWVHIDCNKYQASSHAVRHLSMRKGRLVSAHQTMFKPLRLMRVRHHTAPNGPATHAPAAAAVPAPGGGVHPQVAESFPDTIDHRKDNFEGPVKNQGGVGSCTAHSLSATLDNAAIRAGALKPGDPSTMASPLHVWSRYGMPDMGAAADSNIAKPVAVYSIWPQNDREACELMQNNGGYASECAEAYGVQPGSWKNDSALMAKYNKAQSDGIYKIASIEKLDVKPPNMEELIGILATGADIWSAFLIDGYAFSNSKMTNAVIPDWSDYSGGHAIVISGYRQTPSGKQFLIHNSWGESWGDHGYAWISEAMVQKWLYYAYKVKITNGVPKSELTDDDCAPDELVDLGTGLCSLMCGTDDNPTRPNNGCKK